MATQTAKRLTDIGPPNYEKFLPPLIKRNYGQWRYHETPGARRALSCGRIGREDCIPCGSDLRGC